MTTFGPTNAECFIFTYKDGLLSAVAHDLKIKVGAFEVTVDEASGVVKGEFDAGSLKVVCAMKDGAESPGSLADKDMKEIEANIQKDVLDAKSHPKVSFASKQVSAGGQVTGTLTLHGSSKEISFGIQKQNGKAVAEVKLNQPDFGIKPFSAMLGTLKIKPELTVRLTVPMS